MSHVSLAARCSLTQRGYGVPKDALSPEELAALRKALTFTPRDTGGMGPPGAAPASFPVYQESAAKLYVPKWFGLQRWGVPARCDLAGEDDTSASPTCAIPAARRRFVGILRPEQRPAADAFFAAARDPTRRGAILSLPCGYGKTVVALYLLAQLGLRTVVVVHKGFLLEQWRERIAQYLPDVKVGLVKADALEVEGRDVVLASVQSLSMKAYPPDLFRDFGLTIVDEVHRVGTEVFSRALRLVSTRFSLGLSATVARKDGCTKAFIYFLGDVAYKVGRARADVVRVVQRRFWDPNPAYCKEVTFGRMQKLNCARMINNVTEFGPRIRFIVAAIRRVLGWEPGRKVLVLADRKALLDALKGALGERWTREGARRAIAAGSDADPGPDDDDARGTEYQLDPVSAGLYIGGMKPAALAESETKQVMLATFAYASEGMDVRGLDTLVLASPKSDIEQSCGRILREKADARVRVPLILDVVDGFSVFEAQGKKRRAFYRKHGYAVWPDLEPALRGAEAGGACDAGRAPLKEDDDDGDADADADGAARTAPAAATAAASYLFQDDDA